MIGWLHAMVIVGLVLMLTGAIFMFQICSYPVFAVDAEGTGDQSAAAP